MERWPVEGIYANSWANSGVIGILVTTVSEQEVCRRTPPRGHCPMRMLSVGHPLMMVTVSKETGWPTPRMSVSPLPSHLELAQRVHVEHGRCGRNGSCGFPLTKADLATVTGECLICRQQRPMLSPDVASFPWGTSELPGSTFITLNSSY